MRTRISLTTIGIVPDIRSCEDISEGIIGVGEIFGCVSPISCEGIGIVCASESSQRIIAIVDGFSEWFDTIFTDTSDIREGIVLIVCIQENRSAQRKSRTSESIIFICISFDGFYRAISIINIVLFLTFYWNVPCSNYSMSC